jgi:hypothetical protein
MENIGTLEILREKIELLDAFHQGEILKILQQNVDQNLLNENNNGIFINLSSLNADVIRKMDTYIKYVTKQETQLDAFENQKEEFKVKYFQKDNKEKSTELNNEY